jgi:hypothetical protein
MSVSPSAGLCFLAAISVKNGWINAGSPRTRRGFVRYYDFIGQRRMYHFVELQESLLDKVGLWCLKTSCQGDNSDMHILPLLLSEIEETGNAIAAVCCASWSMMQWSVVSWAKVRWRPSTHIAMASEVDETERWRERSRPKQSDRVW